MKAFTQPLHDLSEYDADCQRSGRTADTDSYRRLYRFAEMPSHQQYRMNLIQCKLIVTYNEIKAKEIYEDYRFFDRNVYYYPAKDIIFYNADIHGNLIVSQRMAVIRRMMDG